MVCDAGAGQSRDAGRSHDDTDSGAVIILDIPLLFESGSVARCDLVLVVSAPARLQRERVMRRPGMSRERFADILRAQMPDREKRRRADFVVATALGRSVAFRKVKAIVA